MFSFAEVNPDFWSQLAPTVVKSVVGLVISGVIGVIVWPFRRMKKEWIEMKADQATIHSELVQQRTNHLTHIEEYGKNQTELLTKMCNVLDGVRLDLAEQTGYLKAFVPAPRIRRAAAKK